MYVRYSYYDATQVNSETTTLLCSLHERSGPASAVAKQTFIRQQHITDSTAMVTNTVMILFYQTFILTLNTNKLITWPQLFSQTSLVLCSVNTIVCKQNLLKIFIWTEWLKSVLYAGRGGGLGETKPRPLPPKLFGQIIGYLNVGPAQIRILYIKLHNVVITITIEEDTKQPLKRVGPNS